MFYDDFFISFVHSLSFSSLRRITNSVQDKSFVNCIYSKVAGKSSNDLSHVDFNIRGIFLNKLIIDRIRYGSLIANTKITYYRHGNHHETPSFVFCRQVLGKRGLSDSLSTKFGPCRKGRKLSKYSKDIKVIMNQVI